MSLYTGAWSHQGPLLHLRDRMRPCICFYPCSVLWNTSVHYPPSFHPLQRSGPREYILLVPCLGLGSLGREGRVTSFARPTFEMFCDPLSWGWLQYWPQVFWTQQKKWLTQVAFESKGLQTGKFRSKCFDYMLTFLQCLVSTASFYQQRIINREVICGPPTIFCKYP